MATMTFMMDFWWESMTASRYAPTLKALNDIPNVNALVDV
jgi:hypothetical protein